MSRMLVAVSEVACNAFLGLIRRNFEFIYNPPPVSNPPFSVEVDIKASLHSGEIKLFDDGTLKIDKLDIHWDKLNFILNINLDRVCVGGWCLIRDPFWGKCLVRVRKVCAFSANPDVRIVVDLSNFIKSEVSARVKPFLSHFDDAHEWRCMVEFVGGDVDVFDIEDMTANVVNEAIHDAIRNTIPGPSIVRDLILTMLGPLDTLVCAICNLSTPDDMNEFIEDTLISTFKVRNSIIEAISSTFAQDLYLFRIADNYEIIKATSDLAPVYIPIEDIDIDINSHEMKLSVIIGN
ncbi:hypothetical protein ES705_17749 [subsurface metagenome]